MLVYFLTYAKDLLSIQYFLSIFVRVSVQGVKSLGGHFASLCQGFKFYEVDFFFVIIFKKENGNTFTVNTFYFFYSEKSSKRAK